MWTLVIDNLTTGAMEEQQGSYEFLAPQFADEVAAGLRLGWQATSSTQEADCYSVTFEAEDFTLVVTLATQE